MIINILLLIIGLVTLVYFSNLFVDSASSIANNFKVPKMIIALTIASFCTCAPELFISFNSVSSAQYDITVSNVIGSLIVNILLIIGIASIIKPIKIKSSTVKKELPLLIVTTAVFSFLFLDGTLSRIDALILLFLFFIFCIYLIKLIKRFKKIEEEEPKYSKKTSLLLAFVSLLFIVLASDLVVDITTLLAHTFNISEKLITMTVIAIGTSLPELTITVSSAKKGEFDMTVGNIIGTNIFNICIVLALPTLIFGSITSNSFNIIDLLITVLASLLFFSLGKSENKITRSEGFLMILTFITYYSYLFLN